MPAEVVSWTEFERRFVWKQGEHVTAIAPTGAGKTTLFSELVGKREWNLFLGTKIDDPLYHKLQRRGFRRIDSITEVTKFHQNWLLWPKAQQSISKTMQHQSMRFAEAFNAIAKHGRWTVWMDEAKYMAQKLHLESDMTYLYEQVRSIKGTLISGAQRPAWLPLSALSNASHVFLWKTPLDADAKRLADVGGVNAREVAAEAKTLGSHEFIYIHARGTEATMLRSQVK